MFVLYANCNCQWTGIGIAYAHTIGSYMTTWMGTWHVFVYFNVLFKKTQTVVWSWWQRFTKKQQPFIINMFVNRYLPETQIEIQSLRTDYRHQYSHCASASSFWTGLHTHPCEWKFWEAFVTTQVMTSISKNLTSYHKVLGRQSSGIQYPGHCNCWHL